MTGNMQCEFNALPYSKQFAKIMSAHVGYVYNEYGYDGYDPWDLDNEEYDKYSVVTDLRDCLCLENCFTVNMEVGSDVYSDIYFRSEIIYVMH